MQKYNLTRITMARDDKKKLRLASKKRKRTTTSGSNRNIAKRKEGTPVSSTSGKITEVKARQVLDSRGNPTVEADVFSGRGAFGRATVPSGASTGVHEALELRDGNPKLYDGKSVHNAVSNIEQVIRPALLSSDCRNQKQIDSLMISLDGTPNKSRLGANAILAVSMASARVASSILNEPLFRYLVPRERYRLPVPMMNVVNGGKHAGNSLAIQEFHVEPIGADSFPEALRIGTEVYHALKQVLKDRYGVSAINVGDEGGYAPPLDKTSSALDAIMEAIKNAGYDESRVKLGLDAASSSFYNEKDNTYAIDERTLSPGELEDYYSNLVSSYPILTLEDPFSEEAFEDSAKITSALGARVRIIGDDIYVTNPKRIARGIGTKATNSILIKLNQIGTVSETLEAVEMSRRAGWSIIVSHRSGETEDCFISHLATAVESEFIKTGAPARGERTAKYNELLRIYETLGSEADFAGKSLAS